MKKKNKYVIRVYYQRAYTPTFNTEREARNWIESRRLRSNTACYTELWIEDERGNGEQIAVFENDTFELVIK